RWCRRGRGGGRCAGAGGGGGGGGGGRGAGGGGGGGGGGGVGGGGGGGGGGRGGGRGGAAGARARSCRHLAASAARERRDEQATRSRRGDVAEHAGAAGAGRSRQVSRFPEDREKAKERKHQSLLGFPVEKEALEPHHGSRGHPGGEELDQSRIARAAARDHELVGGPSGRPAL